MYDAIYSELILTGIAKKYDGDGQYKDALGRKCKYYLTPPEYLLFIDEVVSNTNMANDKNKGGKQLACEIGTVPRQQASTSDVHFIVLGFINASG